MQGTCWQAQAHRYANFKKPCVAHRKLALADRNGVTIVSTWIRAQSDLSLEHDLVAGPVVRAFNARRVVAEIGGDRSCGGSFVDRRSRVMRARFHEQPRWTSANFQRDRDVGAHEGRDEGRCWAVIDLLRRANLGDL